MKLNQNPNMGLTTSAARELPARDDFPARLYVSVETGKIPQSLLSGIRAMWKSHKEEARADGFSWQTRDNGQYTKKVWYLVWYHTITPTTHHLNAEGKKNWLAEFEQKCMKWNARIKAWQDSQKEVVNVEVLSTELES